jgi:hypothetical protein
MNEPQKDLSKAICGTCVHFQNEPAVIEKTWPGLASVGSAFASVRAEDGLCRRHGLYLLSRDSCGDHTPEPA